MNSSTCQSTELNSITSDKIIAATLTAPPPYLEHLRIDVHKLKREIITYHDNLGNILTIESAER